MKPKLPLLVAILVFAGCTSVPLEIGTKMDGVARKYAAINRDMTKEAIVAALGSPQTEEVPTAGWETRYDTNNYDSLAVEFDGNGKPTKITKTRSRRSSSFAGSVERSQTLEK